MSKTRKYLFEAYFLVDISGETHEKNIPQVLVCFENNLSNFLYLKVYQI